MKKYQKQCYNEKSSQNTHRKYIRGSTRHYDITRTENWKSAVIKTVGGEGALRQHF